MLFRGGGGNMFLLVLFLGSDWLLPGPVGRALRSLSTIEGGKAKVVIAVWGTELIQFLAVLAIFHQDDLKNRMHSNTNLDWS